MTKSDFVREIKAEMQAADKDLSISGISDVLQAMTEVITKALIDKDSVTIPKLGTFKAQFREQSNGVNPQTKEKITIPARYVPKFKFSDVVRKAVKGE